MQQPTYDSTGRRVLRGTELRYALVRLTQLTGPASVPELITGLAHWGFAVDGRPSKTVSDALRWERRRGRVLRRGRGLYGAGEMPRSTEHRIISRVMAMRAEVGSVSLGGGQQHHGSGEPEDSGEPDDALGAGPTRLARYRIDGTP